MNKLLVFGVFAAVGFIFGGCVTKPPVVKHPENGHVNPGALAMKHEMEKKAAGVRK